MNNNEFPKINGVNARKVQAIRDDIGNLSQRELAKKHKVDRNDVRKIAKICNGERNGIFPALRGPFKPSAVSDKAIALTIAKIPSALSKASFTRHDASKAMADSIQEENRSNGGNDLALPKILCEKTVSKDLKKIVPEVVSCPSTVDARRLEAVGDIYNNISNAAMFKLIMEVSPEMPNGRFFLGGIASFDCVTALIGGDVKRPIYMLEGSAKLLQKFHRSAARLKNVAFEGQSRTIKSHCLVLDNGELKCVVKIVADYNFTRSRVVLYSQDNGYASYLLTVPAKLGKKN